MKLFTVRDVTNALETDVATVQQWIAAEELWAVKDGVSRDYRITEIDLKNFLESRPQYTCMAINAGLLSMKDY